MVWGRDFQFPCPCFLFYCCSHMSISEKGHIFLLSLREMGRKKKKCTSIYIILHFSLVYVTKKLYLCSRKSAIEYDTYTIDIRYIHVR